MILDSNISCGFTVDGAVFIAGWPMKLLGCLGMKLALL